MLRARLSYQLFGIMRRNLPTGLTTKIAGFLGLKAPTTPALLAGSLILQSRLIMKDAGSVLVEINRENTQFQFPLPARQAEEIAVELLCALYCLALTILGQDDFAAEPNLFQLYALQTQEELEGLLEEQQAAALFKKIGLEARALYLSNSPTLRELANMKGVKYFDEMITKAEREQNWLATYMFKAQIRITDKLPVGPRSIWYLPSAHFFGTALLTRVDFFKTLRPVFVAS